MSQQPETNLEVRFVLRLARALHSYGIPAHRLEEILESAAQKLGLEGQFFSSPTSIYAFIGALGGGVASRCYARVFDRPALITQVPGILLLVPGSVGFRGLAALLDKQVISGVDTAFKMILTAVALVAGTLIASIVAPLRREI